MTSDWVSGIPRHPHDGADILGDVPNVTSVLRVHVDSHLRGVDAVPLDPDDMDDEFRTSSLNAKWSDINIGGVTKTTIGDLLVMGVNESVDQMRGIYQSTPSGDWTIRAKLLRPTDVTDFINNFLFVGENTTGQQYTLGFWGTNAIRGIGFATPTSIAVAAGSESGVWAVHGYIEIEWDDTAGDVFLRYSNSGADGDFLQHHSVTTGFTPTIIGLGITNRRGGQRAVVFEWFRRIA